MRPERPLEPMHSELGASKVKGVNGKMKKRIKPPPVRARRRLIDPTKWDSAYLKGVFLDSVPVPFSTSGDAFKPTSLVKPYVADEEETDKYDTDSDAPSTPRYPASQSVQDRAHVTTSTQQSSEATESADIHDEANAALAMLGKMFGDKEDWDERESVGEMEGLGNGAKDGQEMQVEEEDDIEIVPRDFEVDERSTIPKKDKGKGKERLVGDNDVEAARDRDVEMEDYDPPTALSTELGPETSLRALFAPREDGLSDILSALSRL